MGSTSTIFRERAKQKNCPSTTSRRFRALGAQRPVLLAAFAGEEAGEVTHDGQCRLDGRVAARPCSVPAGPLARAHRESGEHIHRWPQGLGDGVDAALSAAGRKPLALIGGHGHAVTGEEGFQCAGDGAHRASGTTRAFEQSLRAVGLLVQEKSSQGTDHRACAADAVLGGEVGGEVPQPVRGFGEFGDQVLGPDEGPVGVTLPAS
ncbi:hypothetical protein [Streptomyces sporangiiformans]|uniref:Uncharacterized protein n=1 Tax=Streptomyces sporangiiformans TaxID=2315329 RepID=A0A505DKP3_9ACTN|nr:hypothetical protein [Streptomyces sporangiiformans]TPQ22158.1 hypothetical protein FGD71_011150 [Streptomyces sporangiiformans]